MEATSAPPILLPGIDHLPCLQEIRSVKDKPFYCKSSVGTTTDSAAPSQADGNGDDDDNGDDNDSHSEQISPATEPYWELLSSPIVDRCHAKAI